MARALRDRVPTSVATRRVCVAVVGVAALLPVSSSAVADDSLQSHALATRYGTVSWSSDSHATVPGKVFLDGELVKDVGATFELSVAADETVSDRRILLFEVRGGTVCLYSYFFLTLSRHGHATTDYFGSCGPASARRDGDSIAVKVMDNCPRADDACDAQAYETFLFRDGKLEPAGRPAVDDAVP